MIDDNDDADDNKEGGKKKILIKIELERHYRCFFFSVLKLDQQISHEENMIYIQKKDDFK